MNNVVLIGRLVRNPELRFVPGSGMAVANFTMAVDKNLAKDKKLEFEQQGKPTADFIRIVVWGKQAENCSQYLEKGRLVGINGSIQTGSYKTQAGETRYTTDVLASKVEFLEWGDKTQKKAGKDDFNFGGSEEYKNYSIIENDDDVPF